jgi:hypothetical protein
MSGSDQHVGIDKSRVGVASTGANASIASPVYDHCSFVEMNVNGDLSTHRGAAPSIDLSYYRINRLDQLAALESFRSGGRPRICVFYGDVSQCLDKFLECLCGSHWKTRVFGPAGKIFHKFVNWPWEKADADDVRREALNSLAKEFSIPDEQGTPEAIYAATQSTPTLVQALISSGRYSELPDGPAALQRFVEFWDSWPERGRSGAPFLACMVVLKDRNIAENPARPARRRPWLDRIAGAFRKPQDIDACIQKMAADQLVVPEFSSVIFDHVYAWAKEHDIRDRVGRSGRDPAAAIQEIFDDHQCRRIPMQALAQDLSEKFPLSRPGGQPSAPDVPQETP